jgi:hypothetical protein
MPRRFAGRTCPRHEGVASASARPMTRPRQTSQMYYNRILAETEGEVKEKMGSVSANETQPKMAPMAAALRKRPRDEESRIRKGQQVPPRAPERDSPLFEGYPPSGGRKSAGLSAVTDMPRLALVHTVGATRRAPSMEARFCRPSAHLPSTPAQARPAPRRPPWTARNPSRSGPCDIAARSTMADHRIAPPRW